MGQDKGHLHDGQENLLQKSIELLEKTTSQAPLVSGKDEGQVHDIYPQCGPLAGIHACLKKSEADALLIIPVDMPDLDTALLENLVTFFKLTKQTCFYHQHYLPVIVPNSASVMEQLELTLNAQKKLSLRRFLTQINGVSITCPQPHRLTNINTPTEWQSWRQQRR